MDGRLNRLNQTPGRLNRTITPDQNAFGLLNVSVPGNAAQTTPMIETRPVMKEAAQSVVNAGKKVATITRDILQSPYKSAAGIGLQLAGKDQFQPVGPQKIFLGSEPVKKTEVQGTELAQSLLGKDVSVTPMQGIAIGLFSGALDILNPTGKKKLAEEIAKLSKFEDIFKLLKSEKQFAQVGEGVLQQVSKDLAPISDSKAVTNYLNNLIKANKADVVGLANEGERAWMAEKLKAISAYPNAIDDTTWIEDTIGRLNRNKLKKDDLVEVSNYIEEMAAKTGIDITDYGKALKEYITPQTLGRTEAAATVVPRERGFITSVKEELPALKVAGQYIPRSTDTLAIKAANLIKTDIAMAEKVAMGTDDKAVAVGAELLKHYSDEAAKITDKAVQDALYEKAATLANDMAQRLTELGRSVQAASILGRLTPEGQVKFAAREIMKYNEAVTKSKGGILGLQKKIPELSGEQAQKIIYEMNAIKDMPEGTAKAMRFQKLQDYISNLVPTSLFKKIITVWKAGLLTGIKTSGLNIFSNLSHAGSEIAKNLPASMVDKILSLFTGKRTVAATIKGFLRGGKEGAGKGWQYFRIGFDERNIGTKLDFNRINFGKGRIAQALQTYTDTIFRILGTEDQPFYYAAKIRSFYEQAKVAAINKGLKGKKAQAFIDNLIQNPTDKMTEYAAMDAETAVFQNPTKLGQAAKAIQNIGGGVGQIVVPFGRTPSAVAMQIINYSPVGFVTTVIENIGKGRFDQRLFSQGMGRAITGTVALGMGAYLYKKGLLNMARPTGEKEQKLWELEGRTTNSVKIGNKWRSIQVLGPVGNVILIGGYVQQEFSKTGSPTEAIVNTLAGATQSFSQQTFLTGVSNFIDAVSDPARSAVNVAGSTLASSIPTIVSDIARATDDKERRATEILNKVQARIPGLRERLEPQVDVLGAERPTVGNPLEIMIDPTRPSEVRNSPVIEEIRRLWDTGYKVSPTLLGDKNGYSALSPEQNTALWKKAGSITNDKLSSLFSKNEYQTLSEDEKAKVVDNVITKSQIAARAGMVLQLTQNLQGQELRNKLSKLKTSGLMTKEVYNKYLELK